MKCLHCAGLAAHVSQRLQELGEHPDRTLQSGQHLGTSQLVAGNPDENTSSQSGPDVSRAIREEENDQG